MSASIRPEVKLTVLDQPDVGTRGQAQAQNAIGQHGDPFAPTPPAVGRALGDLIKLLPCAFFWLAILLAWLTKITIEKCKKLLCCIPNWVHKQLDPHNGSAGIVPLFVFFMQSVLTRLNANVLS